MHCHEKAFLFSSFLFPHTIKPSLLVCSTAAVPISGCSGVHGVMCGQEGVGAGQTRRRATSIDYSVFQKMKAFW